MGRHTLSPFATEVLEIGATAVGLSTDKYLLADRIIDGGFEIWTSATVPRYWTPSIVATSTVDRGGTVYAGTYSLQLTIAASNNNASVVQAFSMLPGRYYTLSFYYQNSAGSKTSKVTIADSSSTVYLTSAGAWSTSTHIDLANSNAAWALYSLTFAAHGSYTSYTITFANDSAASSNIFVDSVEIVEANTQRAIFPEPAIEAFGVLEAAQIRFTKDGVVPTATIGQILEAGQNYDFEDFDDIRKFQAIRTGSTSAWLTVEYRR